MGLKGGSTLGVAAGPTIGGIITQYLTWRWIFYVNVPICMLVLYAAFSFYREQNRDGNSMSDSI